MPTPLEAELLRGRLAAEGISAELYDVHTASIGFPFASALGGVTVVVNERDEERARDVLAGRGIASADAAHDGEEAEEGTALLPRPLPLRGREDALSGALVAGCVGAACCPPLGVYSLWLLWRSLRRSAVWSVRLRCEAALVFGIDLWASFELLRFFVP
ncbi:MAG: putative signal transducing protein [Myxococcota bacterium]